MDHIRHRFDSDVTSPPHVDPPIPGIAGPETSQDSPALGKAPELTNHSDSLPEPSVDQPSDPSTNSSADSSADSTTPICSCSPRRNGRPPDRYTPTPFEKGKRND